MGELVESNKKKSTKKRANKDSEKAQIEASTP